MEYGELEDYEEYDELDENEAELASTEESTKIKNGQVEFSRVNHSKRAEKFGRNSDGEVANYANYALEYFDNRCALSGEKFYEFDEKISGRGTNLSAEHVIALAIGGHDIVPNIVPTVLQYNIQKNGYYILDWWKKQEDINGKKIYSPYRLLKLVNFMMKSIEARGLSARKYHELLMKPNEIDKYLEKIEKEDLEENDNNKRKILSDTVTATTLDEDNNKILTTVPSTKGNIVEQVEDEIKRKEYNETEMMDTFLIDAVRIIKREKEISQKEIETENGNKITIENKLNQMLEKTIGKIPFEINVRNKILEQLEEIGIENNKYTVASVILKNTDILKKTKNNEEINIEEIIQTRIKNILPKFEQAQKIELISVMPDLLYDDNAVKEYEDNLKWYSEYKNINIEEINPILLTRTHFINIIEVIKWMEDNNTIKPPRHCIKANNIEVPRNTLTLEEREEINLGESIRHAKRNLIEPYTILKVDKEKQEYRSKHPELDEVMQMVNEIDKSIYLVNAIEIKKWMEEHNTTRPPRSEIKINNKKLKKEQCTLEQQEEIRLGQALYSIRRDVINPYRENGNLQYVNYIELKKIIQIIDELDNNKSIYLINAIKIKKWLEEHNTTIPKRNITVNGKRLKKGEGTLEQQEEIKLGNALSTIKKDFIKPYNLLQTEEEKEQYKIKNPELEEVMQIVEEIDRNNSQKVSKKIKEVIVENKQELHRNINVSNQFNETIKEIEIKRQKYEVLN